MSVCYQVTGAALRWGVLGARASESHALEARALGYLNANCNSNWLKAAPRNHLFPGTSDLPCRLGRRANSEWPEKVPTHVLAAGRRTSVP